MSFTADASFADLRVPAAQFLRSTDDVARTSHVESFHFLRHAVFIARLVDCFGSLCSFHIDGINQYTLLKFLMVISMVAETGAHLAHYVLEL